MRVLVGFVLVHWSEDACFVQDVMHHEDGQDRLHAVIGEAFGGFVADDEWNTGRHAGDVGR